MTSPININKYTQTSIANEGLEINALVNEIPGHRETRD